MSLWAEYLKETDDMETYEIPDCGFVSYYQITPERVHIEHIHVGKSYRQKGIGKELLRYVEAYARSLGCKEVTGAVRPSSKAATVSMAAQVACGFKILSAGPNAIFTVKEL